MKIKKNILIVLFSAVFCYFFGGSVCDASEDTYIKVGLYYGSNALASANLANEVGSGYEIGYYDTSLNFVPLYAASIEKISILKNSVIYITSDKLYSDAYPSKLLGAVYPYRLEIDRSFDTVAEAAAYADEISSKANVTAFPAYINGKACVRVGGYKSAQDAENAVSAVQSITGDTMKTVNPSGTCFTVTKTQTDKILFELDSSGISLGIRPVSTGQKTQTWFKGYKYCGGFEYRRNGGNITVINVVELNDYIKGVVPYEMNAAWPDEALKAQALCAKSYALGNLKKHSKYGFNVCNSTDCQVYGGTNLATEHSNDCVDNVRDVFLTYNGKPITPFYHSSNGGYTENSENIWNEAIPYLRAVPDTYEDLDSCKNGRWSFKFTLEDITDILKSKGYKVNRVTDIYVDKYTDAGNVYSLSVVDSTGNILKFTKENARTVLNSSNKNIYTYSQRYTIGGKTDIYANDAKTTLSLKNSYALGGNGVKMLSLSEGTAKAVTASGTAAIENKTSSGTYILEGKGWGHNVGMSQNGAKGMALAGFTFEQILKHYFTGVEVSGLSAVI